MKENVSDLLNIKIMHSWRLLIQSGVSGVLVGGSFCGTHIGSLWNLSSAFRHDQQKYMLSKLQQNWLSYYCWFLYASPLLQGLSPTRNTDWEALQTDISMGWFPYHTVLVQTSNVQASASQTSETTGVLDSACFHNHKAAPEVFGCLGWSKPYRAHHYLQ